LWRLAPYSIAVLFIVSIFATPTAMLNSAQPAPNPDAGAVVFDAGADSASSQVASDRPISDPAVASVLGLIEQNSRMNAVRQARIARAVVASARKYDVDPYLVVSVLLVESSGDPFAISNRDAVGIMQIHVPTWRALVDMEQINLFRIEDNIDLGVRIMADYTGRYGLSEGLMRYLGAGEPTEEASLYVSRIEGIYLNRNAD
jgi:soluble lytic murein transglycosylase-like protein